MSGIRPSGFGCRCDWAILPPSTRAPVMVSASFGMVRYRGRRPGSAGLLRPRGLCPGAPLPTASPRAVAAAAGRGSAAAARRSGPAAPALSAPGPAVPALADRRRRVSSTFGLEDAHGSAQRPGGVRHLPGAEQDKHHNRDNQHFQWAVEQVTYVHLSPHSGGKRVPAPWVACIESLHKTAPGGTAQAYWASAAAASSRISAARSAGEVTRPSSPSRSASRRTIRVSGVRSPTRSRPSPRSVTRSQG